MVGSTKGYSENQLINPNEQYKINIYKLDHISHVNNQTTSIFNFTGRLHQATRTYIVYEVMNMHIAPKTSKIKYKTKKGTEIKAYLPNEKTSAETI